LGGREVRCEELTRRIQASAGEEPLRASSGDVDDGEDDGHKAGNYEEKVEDGPNPANACSLDRFS
jgi:hypothetical protein